MLVEKVVHLAVCHISAVICSCYHQIGSFQNRIRFRRFSTFCRPWNLAMKLAANAGYPEKNRNGREWKPPENEIYVWGWNKDHIKISWVDYALSIFTVGMRFYELFLPVNSRGFFYLFVGCYRLHTKKEVKTAHFLCLFVWVSHSIITLAIRNIHLSCQVCVLCVQYSHFISSNSFLCEFFVWVFCCCCCFALCSFYFIYAIFLLILICW